jgi:hypothetical protein
MAVDALIASQCGLAGLLSFIGEEDRHTDALSLN